MVNLIKLWFSTIRWGSLDDSDKEIIKKTSFSKILRANYIGKTSISQSTTVTLK